MRKRFIIIQIVSLVSIVIYFLYEKSGSQGRNEINKPTSLTAKSVRKYPKNIQHDDDVRVIHPKPLTSTKKISKNNIQSSYSPLDLVIDYNNLSGPLHKDYIDVYKRMSRISDAKIFYAINSDMVASGFPKLPNTDTSSFGVLKFAYMALSNSIDDEEQISRIRNFLESSPPNLTTQNGREISTNLNKTALICSLGISGNREIFDILRNEYISTPSVDIGVGMAAFWFDYTTRYYKKFFINASHPLEPFYDDNFFTKSKLVPISVHALYRKWSTSLVSQEVSDFLTQIGYVNSSITLR